MSFSKPVYVALVMWAITFWTAIAYFLINR